MVNDKIKDDETYFYIQREIKYIIMSLDLLKSEIEKENDLTKKQEYQKKFDNYLNRLKQYKSFLDLFQVPSIKK